MTLCQTVFSESRTPCQTAFLILNVSSPSKTIVILGFTPPENAFHLGSGLANRFVW